MLVVLLTIQQKVQMLPAKNSNMWPSNIMVSHLCSYYSLMAMFSYPFIKDYSSTCNRTRIVLYLQ